MLCTASARSTTGGSSPLACSVGMGTSGMKMHGAEVFRHRHQRRHQQVAVPNHYPAAAQEGRRAVVGMALYPGRQREQAVLGKGTPAQLVSGDKPSDHGCGAAAETPAERYVVAARDPDVGHRLPGLREGALYAPVHEIFPVPRQGVLALAGDIEARAAQFDPDLAPDIQG